MEYTHVRNPRNRYKIEHPLLIGKMVPTHPTHLTNKKALCNVPCNVTSLFDQAYKFSSDHSWYKLKEPEIVYTLLQPFDDGSGWKLAICCQERDANDDSIIENEMAQRVFALNADHYETGDVPQIMVEHSFKYPVTITSDLGGDGYSLLNENTARYLFDRYIWYMKKKYLIPAESNDLPPFDAEMMSSFPRSIVPSYGQYEKWRILGQIVNAACSVASDCGITVNSDLPFPSDSPVYDYMRK